MLVNSNPYFLDSNIWLYALVNMPVPSEQENQKREKADALIDSSTVVISTHVINEVCSNLLKKSNFCESRIQQLIHSFYNGCRVLELHQEILIRASHLSEAELNSSKAFA